MYLRIYVLCIRIFANVSFHCFTYTRVQEENHPRMMHVTKQVVWLRHSGVEWFQYVLDIRKFHIVVLNNFRWLFEEITYFDMSRSMSWKFSHRLADWRNEYSIFRAVRWQVYSCVCHILAYICDCSYAWIWIFIFICKFVLMRGFDSLQYDT